MRSIVYASDDGEVIACVRYYKIITINENIRMWQDFNPEPPFQGHGEIFCRERLGGLLRYSEKAAQDVRLESLHCWITN